MSIARDSLMSLEAYSRARADFRARIIPHRRLRTVFLGEHVSLQFEDELTVRYQIQEMLRIEKIFEEEGIREEIAVYGPLVPDGSNWKATMLIEYDDEAVRRAELARLLAIEDQVWVQIAGHGKVYAIADEDLERSSADKTSAVHFLRFELDPAMAASAKAGAALAMGVDHPNYQVSAAVPEPTRAALVADLA
ncbi:hypothetical protein GALL_202290 [mine drainage metagenome]|uniref:DUF3501 family protein n=1 Tax=mine drainage metagenome TaxID=410659 RepID=A0A1J5S0S0_9ZZZZ